MLYMDLENEVEKDIDTLKASMDTEIEKAMYMQAQMLDKRIKICLQPKPKFMPIWLWKKVIGRLLYLEEIR